MTISGYEDVPRNSEESLLKALAHQPVSVAVEASGRDFQFYRGVSDSCHADMSVEMRPKQTDDRNLVARREFSTDLVGPS